MDRIESIKNTIERNSKMMKKHTLRIQELKDELDSIDSQIKWVPVAELDEKQEKTAYNARIGLDLPDCIPGAILIQALTSSTPSAADDFARRNRIQELQKKRIPLQNELDTLIREKERLRNENLRLREEARNLK